LRTKQSEVRQSHLCGYCPIISDLPRAIEPSASERSVRPGPRIWPSLFLRPTHIPGIRHLCRRPLLAFCHQIGQVFDERGTRHRTRRNPQTSSHPHAPLRSIKTVRSYFGAFSHPLVSHSLIRAVPTPIPYTAPHLRDRAVQYIENIAAATGARQPAGISERTIFRRTGSGGDRRARLQTFNLAATCQTSRRKRTAARDPCGGSNR